MDIILISTACIYIYIQDLCKIQLRKYFIMMLWSPSIDQNICGITAIGIHIWESTPQVSLR